MHLITNTYWFYKRFGGNPYLGTLGMILVHPDAYDFFQSFRRRKSYSTRDVFGLHEVGYQGQVLPMLVATYILATIEKWHAKLFQLC